MYAKMMQESMAHGGAGPWSGGPPMGPGGPRGGGPPAPPAAFGKGRGVSAPAPVPLILVPLRCPPEGIRGQARVSMATEGTGGATGGPRGSTSIEWWVGGRQMTFCSIHRTLMMLMI